MKLYIWIVFILFILSSLSGQDNNLPLSLSIRGPNYYNVLRISSFDVKNPHHQPNFFTLTTENTGEADIVEPYLHFTFKWNDDNIIDPGTKTQYRRTIRQGERVIFTNRDLFVESDQIDFSRPTPSISISDVIDNVPHIRDTVLKTGLFPDGRYIFMSQFRDREGNRLSNEVSFTFVVRNPGGIFLISPGTPLGVNIPTISSSPISFNWISNLTGTQNLFHLQVTEFEDSSDLSPGFIDVSGNQVLNEENLSDTFYSNFIDLKDGRYYAWQVSTSIIDPAELTTSEITSQYYAFRYSSNDNDNDGKIINDILFLLMSFNQPEIMDLIASGFVPSGIIEHNGRVYRMEEIQSILQDIAMQNIISIEIVD